MGEKYKRISIVSFLVILLFMPLVGHSSARSVHSVSNFDLFPQGDFSDSGLWQSDSGVSFLTLNAEYTESMVADDRMTLLHSRPDNFQSLTTWASNSPTNSNLSTGAPDQQYTYTAGPIIELDTFDVSSMSSYELVSVSVVAAFHIPDKLEQDQVQITMKYDDNYENLVTYVNTQSSIDYMNGSLWTKNVTSISNWNWQMIEDIEIDLDYVSVGSTDDSRLDVDALGIEVVVKYPWYGSEWASSTSIFSGHSMPIVQIDLSNGTNDNMAVAQCGLSPSVSGASGSWTSEIIEAPPSQTIGRVHYSLDDSSIDDVVMEVSSSTDGVSFSEFSALTNHGLVEEQFVKIKITSTDSCVSGISADYNNPSLKIDGRIFGSLDGLSTANSRWKVFVNNQEVAYQSIAQLGSFNLDLPIGQYLDSNSDSIEVRIRAWFNWDSNGTSSTTALEISSISVTGGFDLEWDEDPTCNLIGTQHFLEDGGGKLIPFVNGCVDDRTSHENLAIDFSIENESLISVDISQDDIRILLKSEASGTTTVLTTVSDQAGNQWQETFIVIIDSVDDSPVLNEFPAVVPVELAVSTLVPFTYSDIDSTGLTAYTNKSWATIDLDTGYITVIAPTPGSIVPVEINICDQTTCAQRILDLEVQSLPDLEIEEIVVTDKEIYHRDIIPISVYVRNNGDAEATLISVRCQQGVDLVDIQTISILLPGELAVVTCEWQVPESIQSATISVEIDRGGDIVEGNEDNNQAEIIVQVLEEKESDSTSSGFEISGSSVWIITIIVLVIIIGLFTLLTPPKIRKIN
ncbi:MAG: hypothetical protein DWB99_08190 [Candidatus Poseidoniales archaeon]|nr:MAG: hypothetical protein DWB99_08190 [Candidatus Poseidoniales archaeon]